MSLLALFRIASEALDGSPDAPYNGQAAPLPTAQLPGLPRLDSSHQLQPPKSRASAAIFAADLPTSSPSPSTQQPQPATPPIASSAQPSGKAESTAASPMSPHSLHFPSILATFCTAVAKQQTGETKIVAPVQVQDIGGARAHASGAPPAADVAAGCQQISQPAGSGSEVENQGDITVHGASATSGPWQLPPNLRRCNPVLLAAARAMSTWFGGNRSADGNTTSASTHAARHTTVLPARGSISKEALAADVNSTIDAVSDSLGAANNFSRAENGVMAGDSTSTFRDQKSYMMPPRPSFWGVRKAGATVSAVR